MESVEVRARVSGYLTSVDFKAGSIVKKGDPLFTIDPRPYQADLDRANGTLQQAQAQLKLAQSDLDRARDLRTKNVIAANEFDNKAATFLQGQGATAIAEAAKLNLEFCYIRSPIDGRVSRENVTVGNLVQPSTGQDGILTTVVAVDPLIITVIVGGIAAFTLPISQYPEVTPPTVVVTASYPGANPTVVAETVATPIKEQINGVENMPGSPSRSRGFPPTCATSASRRPSVSRIC